MNARPTATGIRRRMRMAALVALATALAYVAAPAIAPTRDAVASHHDAAELAWITPHVGAARHVAPSVTLRLVVTFAAVAAVVVLTGTGAVVASRAVPRSSRRVERCSPRRGPPPLV